MNAPLLPRFAISHFCGKGKQHSVHATKKQVSADAGNPTWLPNNQRCGFQTEAFQPLSDCLASDLHQEPIDKTTMVDEKAGMQYAGGHKATKCN